MANHNLLNLTKTATLFTLTLLIILPVYSVKGVKAAANCAADYNKSGTVDINDFAQFAANYKKTGITCSLDIVGGNCLLDLSDFAAFAQIYKVANACATTPTSTDLDSPIKKEIAMQLVSSAENSSLDWKAQYRYIEDIGDGRGYTGGIVGFTSGTHDMLELVQYYKQIAPGNILEKYIPALIKVDGTSSHTGLGTAYVNDWHTAALDTLFQKAQNDERDRVYFNPAVAQAKADGLHALGQFIYYDALVMHGPGEDNLSFGGIRRRAINKALPPSQGGNETTYLNAFLDIRKATMLTEAAHDDTSRVDTEQRVFLNAGNLNLDLPLSWKTYGDPYTITSVTP